MADMFRIGVSADFKVFAPEALEPILAGLRALPYVEQGFFQGAGSLEVTPDQVRDYDGLISLRPRFTAASFVGADRPVVISRWGVGYDTIDVPACTEAGVLLTITPDAIRRPVAETIVTLLLAAAKGLRARDRVVRTGRWDLKGETPSVGLKGKTLGSVGLGSIGADMFRLLKPFEFGRLLAADPYASPEKATQLGVQLVDVRTLFRESDFIAINCLLSSDTRGMVNAELLALMKPTAFLINTARGAIVDEGALVTALRERRIAGAALDVFSQEPLPGDHPLTQLDNVTLSPHNMAWSDNLYRDQGQAVCDNVLAVLRGEVPSYVVNRDLVQRPSFQAKLASLRERWLRLVGQA
jgi:phosphoglycerate dehydrogenase-like enzyme